MTGIDCAREEEIVSLVLAGRWPEGADEALAAHVRGCAVCSEVASAATLLRGDFQRAAADVHLPAAGQVWWRAAVRARLDAAQAAQQPMTWAHGLAGAMAVGFLAALAGLVWPAVAGFAEWMTARAAAIDPAAAGVASLMTGLVQRSLPLAMLGIACLAVVPIAVYFALSDD